jgi:enolase-phosphatase E1
VLRAVLLDIEGTTSPISFVYNVLFPYAEERLRDFVLARYEDAEIRRVVSGLYHEYQHESEPAPAWVALEDMEGAVSYLEWLMERDRKSTGLKATQGLIWQSGFENGELKGEFFPDVEPALKRWRGAGAKVFIFSSGSVLAQQLLFRYSTFGDLSSLIEGHFDTETGPKRQASSYATIADAIGFEPGEILFISDVLEELTAAHEAGLDVRLALRPGNRPVAAHGFEVVENFEGL